MYRLVCALCMLLTIVHGDVGVDVLLASEQEVTLLNTTLARTSDHSTVLAVDYHYSKGLGFAVWAEHIYRFSLAANDPGGPADPVAIATTSYCSVFTVDWVHDHVIWPDCGHFTELMMADLDGSNQAVLVELSRGRFTRVTDIVVDPYKGKLFFVSEESLQSCGLDGQGLHALTSEFPGHHISTLALDLASERLYFTGFLNGSDQLFYTGTGYNGSQYCPVRVFGADEQVWGVGIFQEQMFYLSHVVDNASFLLQASVHDDRLHQAKVLATGKTISQMKLVHPELQSPAQVDVCTYRGCSHHCVVEAMAARCLCPRRFKLDHNQTTCESLGVEYFTFYTVMAGTACVLLVLLTAGVLMCICDKIWSTVHPTAILLTNPAAAALQRSAIYKGESDVDNLI